MSSKVVVSLSSIPPRFDELGPTLSSLLAQSRAPDEILLWIPQSYRRFPDWDGKMPVVPEGVTVLRCEQDLGPATKVLPTLARYEGQETDILFCDDDRLYSPQLVAMLMAVRSEYPSYCLSVVGRDLPGEVGRPARVPDRLPRVDRRHSSLILEACLKFGRVLRGKRGRVRSSGFADLFYGFGGVLVRSGYFTPDVFKIPPVLWAVDDVWLSGQLARNNVPIWVDARLPLPAPRRNVMELSALLDAKIDDHNRDEANRACIEYFRRTYGIWKPTLSERFLSRFRPMVQRVVDLLRHIHRSAAPRLGGTDR